MSVCKVYKVCKVHKGLIHGTRHTAHEERIETINPKFLLTTSPCHHVTNSPVHQFTSSPVHEFTSSPVKIKITK